MNFIRQNKEKSGFEIQDISMSNKMMCFLIAVLVAMLTIAILCIGIILSNVTISNVKIIIVFCVGAFVGIFTFISCMQSFVNSSYQLTKDNKLRIYNAYYPIPILLPIDDIIKICPVKNRRILLENRIGLRIIMKGKYRFLPYPIDLYLKDENLFINQIKQLNSNIYFTEEVITDWRLGL